MGAVAHVATRGNPWREPGERGRGHLEQVPGDRPGGPNGWRESDELGREMEDYLAAVGRWRTQSWRELRAPEGGRNSWRERH